jgi:hypothetical protein
MQPHQRPPEAHRHPLYPYQGTAGNIVASLTSRTIRSGSSANTAERIAAPTTDRLRSARTGRTSVCGRRRPDSPGSGR